MGRKMLKAAGFEEGPNTGQNWECWRNAKGVPMSVPYVGNASGGFSTIDLEEVIAHKNDDFDC
jgi:hypothetical protein